MIDEQLLKNVMATVLEVPVADIHEGSSMDDIASWDSIRHLSLVLALEEEFGVQIPDEDAADITSYKLIRLVLSEHLSGVAG
jgi:acyl carrier protein